MKNKNLISVDPIMAKKEKSLVSIMQTSNDANKIQKAFDELYENRYVGVFNWLKIHLKNNVEDAEDLLQEVFVKAWANIKLYNFSTNFSTWLYAIAKNTLIDHIRKQKYEIIHMDSMTPSLNDGADSFKDRSFQLTDFSDKDGLAQMEADEYKSLVHKAINQIKNDNMRDIIRMKYIEQLSGKEICKKLDMNVGTFKANNFRAEEFVREFIERTGFDATPFRGQRNTVRKLKTA